MSKSPEQYAITIATHGLEQDDFVRYLWCNWARFESKPLTLESVRIFASNGGKQEIYEQYADALSRIRSGNAWQQLRFDSGLGETLREEDVHAIQEEEEEVAWQTTSATIAAMKAAAAYSELLQAKHPQDALIIKSDVTYHWEDENEVMHVLNKPNVENKRQLFHHLCGWFSQENGRLELIGDTSLAVVEYKADSQPSHEARIAVIGRVMDFSLNLGENYKEILALYVFGDHETALKEVNDMKLDGLEIDVDPLKLQKIQAEVEHTCAESGWDAVDSGNHILDVNGGLKIQHPILFSYIENVNGISSQEEGFDQARADLVFYMRGGSHELFTFIDYWQQDTQWLGTDEDLSQIVNTLSEEHLNNATTFSIGSVFRLPTNKFKFNKCLTHYNK
jgi:hypothetical protein